LRDLLKSKLQVRRGSDYEGRCVLLFREVSIPGIPTPCRNKHTCQDQQAFEQLHSYWPFHEQH